MDPIRMSVWRPIRYVLGALMTDQPGNTTVLQGLLQRLAAGDNQAREELITHSMDRVLPSGVYDCS